MQAFSIDWMKCDHFSLKLIELIVESIDELNGDLEENMFLPYHAKNQPRFQVFERIYCHFIKICKYAKISWFLQMAGNLKSSYELKYVFTLPCQKSASFSVSERTYSHFMEIPKYAKISWFLQMMGNLKTSYQFKYVFPYHTKNHHHFHVSERIYSHFIKIGKFCKYAKIS